MADQEKPSEEWVNSGIHGIEAMAKDLENPMSLIERVYQLWWNWADFHIYVINPYIAPKTPVLIKPEVINSAGEVEFVYPIMDYGSTFSTSKAQDMFSAGMSMCKLFFTVEKIIGLLIDRLKEDGVTPEQEVQIALGGHQLAQRKGFETIISLNYNLVVTNFDPGQWGENYLRNVKVLADKGYGYPPEAPRDNYKRSYTSTPGMKR